MVEDWASLASIWLPYLSLYDSELHSSTSTSFSRDIHVPPTSLLVHSWDHPWLSISSSLEFASSERRKAVNQCLQRDLYIGPAPNRVQSGHTIPLSCSPLATWHVNHWNCVPGLMDLQFKRYFKTYDACLNLIKVYTRRYTNMLHR